MSAGGLASVVTLTRERIGRRGLLRRPVYRYTLRGPGNVGNDWADVFIPDTATAGHGLRIALTVWPDARVVIGWAP